MLLDKALGYLRHRKNRPVQMKYFYRNKPEEYFDNIFLNEGGIMKPYLKDHNGDPGSAINGAIRGLFFSTRVDQALGMPPPSSPFGEKRYNIPVEKLMHTNCGIYFADFYCNFKQHYVTIVVTQKGSDTDLYCQQFLVDIGLNGAKNHFLRYHLGEDRFYCATALIVEILYTEEIDMHKEFKDPRVFFSESQIRGKGTSTRLGLPKNKNCHQCNLYLDDEKEN